MRFHDRYRYNAAIAQRDDVPDMMHVETIYH